MGYIAIQENKMLPTLVRNLKVYSETQWIMFVEFT